MATERRVLRILAILVALIAGWFVFWSVDYSTQRTTVLSEHLRLVERVQVERSAFSLAGGDGGFAALPIPSRYERVVEQRILRGGETLWTGSPGGNRDVDAHVSPDERLVALESRVRQQPLAVYDFAAARSLSMPEPDAVRAQSHWGYEPRFFGWSADSRFFFMSSQEADFGDNVYETWYRSIWKVDAQSGRTTLDRRCADRFPHNPDRGPDWSATVCADPPAGLR